MFLLDIVGIIRPVVNASELIWYIRFIYVWNLQLVYQIYLCLKFTVGISDLFMFEIYSWYIRFIYVWNLQLVYQIYLCLKFTVLK